LNALLASLLNKRQVLLEGRLLNFRDWDGLVVDRIGGLNETDPNISRHGMLQK
jgi:hypothetical protein